MPLAVDLGYREGTAVRAAAFLEHPFPRLSCRLAILVSWGVRVGRQESGGAGLALVPWDPGPARAAPLCRLGQQRPACVSGAAYGDAVADVTRSSPWLSANRCWDLPSAEVVHLCVSMHPTYKSFYIPTGLDLLEAFGYLFLKKDGDFKGERLKHPQRV